MKNWHLIRNNEVIDSIVAESKSFVESQFPDYEILEDDNIIGIGWKRENGFWKPDYPTDGKEYIWDDESHSWQMLYSPDEESVTE